MIAATSETARQAATGGDLPVAAVYIAVIGIVFLVAGGIFDFLEWLQERRRRVSGLTGDQLAERGVTLWPRDQASPPWPHEKSSWDELFRSDGEVVR